MIQGSTVDYPKKWKSWNIKKCLLTLDVGWSNKHSCKISAFYLENRKLGGHLKLQLATTKIKKSWISKIESYFKKLLFFPLEMDYEVNCWCSMTRNTITTKPSNGHLIFCFQDRRLKFCMNAYLTNLHPRLRGIFDVPVRLVRASTCKYVQKFPYHSHLTKSNC